MGENMEDYKYGLFAHDRILPPIAQGIESYIISKDALEDAFMEIKHMERALSNYSGVAQAIVNTRVSTFWRIIQENSVKINYHKEKTLSKSE